jgi:hypothetical protein
MTKSLLEEIQENSQFVARCPACTQTPGLADTAQNQMGPGKNGVHKRGRYKGQFRSSMPLCAFCKGSKVVFLNRICECGMPAVMLDVKRRIWSCGSALCVEHAAWRSVGHSSYNSADTSGTGPSMDWSEYGG